MNWLLNTDAIRWVAVGCIAVVGAGFAYVVLARWRVMPRAARLVLLAVGLLLTGVAVGVIANMSQPLPPAPHGPPPAPGVQLPPTRGVKWTSGFGAAGALLVLWAMATDWLSRRKRR